MNPLQPSASWSAARQRMDERQAAATTHRLARIVEPKPNSPWSRTQAIWHELQADVRRAVNRWRHRAGKALIGLGERITTASPGLKEV